MRLPYTFFLRSRTAFHGAEMVARFFDGLERRLLEDDISGRYGTPGYA